MKCSQCGSNLKFIGVNQGKRMYGCYDCLSKEIVRLTQREKSLLAQQHRDKKLIFSDTEQCVYAQVPSFPERQRLATYKQIRRYFQEKDSVCKGN